MWWLVKTAFSDCASGHKERQASHQASTNPVLVDSRHKKIELTRRRSTRFLDQHVVLSERQLSLRSRSGFFLRRRRNFVHSRSSSSRSGAATAARRSRAARGLGGTAGRGRLAAAHRLDLARGRSTGGGARGRSSLRTAGCLLSTALDLRSLAALDLRGLAAVTGFSGSAERGQNCQGRAQRNQLHRTTHDVSLSLHYDGSASWPSIEVNEQSPHGLPVQDDSRPTLPGR